MIFLCVNKAQLLGLFRCEYTLTRPRFLFKVTNFLTDQHISDLSQWLQDDIEIRNLGLKLGVPEHDIAAELKNNKDDKRKAAHAILKLWRRGQVCPMQAYDTLCEALVKANFKYYAVQALGYKSPSSAS